MTEKRLVTRFVDCLADREVVANEARNRDQLLGEVDLVGAYAERDD